SPYVECTECGWTARCPDCNVTLTYHTNGERLGCHYCGHTIPVPARCPSCRVTDVVPVGFGTEKIEQEIARLFPEARVARLDRDSVTSERAFSAIVADFAEHRTDILVGTQMIAKGFDFGGVSLVGVLNADNLLNNPDFRAAERAYQLLAQVAGRAGRRDGDGEVVIQTAEPGHPVLRQVLAGDFEAMACEQLADREAFFYPPYARLTSLTLRHRDPALLRRGAMWLAERLRARFGRRVLGPMAPPVDRIRGEYLAGLLLKVENGASALRAREILAGELRVFAEHPEFKSVTVVADVDPQ
ncbi:MAG: primosomal protein N', partial [Alistipes sp.]|nr:primosomal protein N' [Alistipes sp.]